MKNSEMKEKETQDINNETAVNEEQQPSAYNGQEKVTEEVADKQKTFPKKQAKRTVDSYEHADSEFFRRLSMFNYLNAHNFIALDIDRDKINYLTGKIAKRGIQVLDHGMEINQNKHEEQDNSLQDLLENIKSEHGKSGNKVFVSFFSPDMTIKQFVLPKLLKTKELENAISFKLQAELSGFDEDSRWHYKIIEEFTEDNTESYRVLVVVVPGEIVDNMMEVLYAAGFRPDILLPRPIAAYNAYFRMMHDIDADILVDISYDITHIYLITNNNLEYTREITSGAVNFETAVHDNNNRILRPETTVVEEGIAESGATRADKIRDALNLRLKILQNQQDPALQLFKNELENSIQYFNRLQPKKHVRRIFLTGYGIQKEGLVSYLKKSMKLPVFLLAPRLNEWEKDVLEFGQYFTAIGSAHTVKDAFDLVPKEYRKRKIYSRLNFLMVLIIILYSFGLFYTNSAINNSTAQMKMQLADMSMQYDALHPIELEYNETNRQISNLKAEQNKLLDLMKKRSPLIEAMKFLSNETPAQIVLSDFSISMINNSNNNKRRNGLKFSKQKAEKKVIQKPAYILQFTGNVISDYLLSDITLINYVDHLKDLNVFKAVDLVYKDKKSSRQSMRFEIKITL